MFLSLHRVAAFPHQRCCLYIDQTGLMVRFFFFFNGREGRRGLGKREREKIVTKGCGCVLTIGSWISLLSLSPLPPSLPPLSRPPLPSPSFFVSPSSSNSPSKHTCRFWPCGVVEYDLFQSHFALTDRGTNSSQLLA